MDKLETAIFASGCFWCTEAIFKMLKGVKSVEPGYAGGTTINPTYNSIGDHAESVKIDFDPTQIDYEKLLTVFFATHDPTTSNRQGFDIGRMYRSMVLYSSDEQKSAAEKYIQKINSSDPNGAPVVTEVKPVDKFYPAEDYHRDYYSNHTETPYCQVVINPKLTKVKKDFADLLKN